MGKLTIDPPRNGVNYVGGRNEAGFIVEAALREELGLAESRILANDKLEKIGGNAVWDAFTPAGMPVSIKAPYEAKNLGVGLSDWRRHRLHSEDFILILAPRLRSDPYRHSRLEIYLVDHREWIRHFPLDYEARIQELFDGVSGDYSYDPIWRQRYKDFKAEWNLRRQRDGLLVNFNAKRGHSRPGSSSFQLRMQCSIRASDIPAMGGKLISREELV